MTHYICKGGCNGVAEEPGTCQATDCADHQKDLVACECGDSADCASLSAAAE